MKSAIYNDNRPKMIARHKQLPFQTHLNPTQFSGRVDPAIFSLTPPSGSITRSTTNGTSMKWAKSNKTSSQRTFVGNLTSGTSTRTVKSQWKSLASLLRTPLNVIKNN